MIATTVSRTLHLPRRLSRRFATAAAVLLSAAVLAASAQAAAPAVLEQVPDNAAVVVVVQNLQKFSNKISNLATRMRLPVSPNVLALLEQQLGVDKGLDENGTAAFVVMMPAAGAPAATDEAPQPPFVMLLPTTDAKAMLAPYSPVAGADGTSTVTLPDGETGYVATLGKFVAMSPSATTLKDFMGHKTNLAAALTPAAEKTFENNDLVAYLNFPAFEKKANATIDNFQNMATMMMGGNNQTPAANKAMAQQVLTSYADGLHRVITDTQIGLINFNLGDDGVTLGFTGHFTKDSPTAKFVAAQAPKTAPNLTGFAGGDILAAATAHWDRASVAKLVGDISDQIASNPELTQEEAQTLTKTLALQKQMIGMTDEVRGVIYAPANPAQGILTKGAAVARVTDSAQFIQLAQQAMSNVPFGNNVPGMKVSVDVTPSSLTVDGVALTKLAYHLKADPAAANASPDEAAKIKESLEKIYGSDGTTVYVGALDATHVIEVFSPDEDFVKSAVKNAKSGDTGLEKQLHATHVVENPFAIVYAAVDKWVEIGMQMANRQAAPASQPAGTAIGSGPAPVIFSEGATATSGSAQLFIPTSLLVSVSKRIQSSRPRPQQQQMQPQDAE